ncbi:hypothetical protein BGZ96_008270, partial [Linnemannia gamsii]
MFNNSNNCNTTTTTTATTANNPTAATVGPSLIGASPQLVQNTHPGTGNAFAIADSNLPGLRPAAMHVRPPGAIMAIGTMNGQSPAFQQQHLPPYQLQSLQLHQLQQQQIQQLQLQQRQAQAQQAQQALQQPTQQAQLPTQVMHAQTLPAATTQSFAYQ